MAFRSKIIYDVDSRDIDKARQEVEKLRKENKLTEKEVKDIEKAYEGVGKEVKKTGGQAQSLGKIIAGLGLAALATAAAVQFAKLSQELTKNRREAALLSQETGKALDNIVVKARSTAKVFDKEFNEVIRAANSISKEFGITMAEAIEKINSGFMRGADINGEYLETLKEYSGQVRSAGLDVDQFNQLIQTSVQEGIFSDKGIDVVKEGMLRIREMTVATRDALKLIGIDGEQMQERLRTGQITLFEAIQEVSRGLENVSESGMETGTILADVFGGPGEDAGIRFVKLLATIDGGFEELNEEQKIYNEDQQRSLELAEKVERTWLPMLKKLGTAWREVKIDVLDTIDAIQGAFKSITTEEDIFQETLNEFADKSLIEVQNRFMELSLEIDHAKKVMDEFIKEGVEPGSDQLKPLAGRILDLQTQYRALNEILNENNKKTSEQNKVIEENTEVIKENKDQVIEVIKARKDEELDTDWLEELTEKEIQDEIDLNNELFRINKERLDKEQQAEQQAANEKERIRDYTIQTIADGFNFLSEIQNDAIQRELQNENLSDSERRKLMRKQAGIQKAQALFNAAIAIPEGVLQTIATLGLPAASAFIPFVLALGGANLALIASQPIPRFGKGKIDIRGKRHSEGGILAEIEDRESVINRTATMRSPRLLDRINRLELDDSVLAKIDRNVIVNVDNRELAELYRNRPVQQINIDEDGITERFITKQHRLTRQHKRFFG